MSAILDFNSQNSYYLTIFFSTKSESKKAQKWVCKCLPNPPKKWVCVRGNVSSQQPLAASIQRRPMAEEWLNCSDFPRHKYREGARTCTRPRASHAHIFSLEWKMWGALCGGSQGSFFYSECNFNTLKFLGSFSGRLQLLWSTQKITMQK